MAISPLDTTQLQAALLAAEAAIGRSDPNPRVGCVIGRPDGTVLAVGSTQQAGGPHAEVVALRAAQAAGQDLQGATAWVTLEPCAHHGRTPPCNQALIQAGVTRVVVAALDPNPLVAGRGVEGLRAAGVEVNLIEGPLAEAARELNIGFFSRHERGRPWVRAKMAISLDGRSALANGASQWITGPEARLDGHRWRRRAGAILTGIGTVLADDPRLDVRGVDTVLQPLRVVVDSALRTPPQARLLAAPGQALICTASGDIASTRALEAAGAQVLRTDSADGRIDLHALIQTLGRMEINEVHVEAGAALTGSLVALGLVDELLVYVAPTLLGPGRDAVSWPALDTLAGAPRFRFVDLTAVGADLRLRARPLP